MYQQLVKKPSGNERPGYRGDDAYGGNSGNSAAVGGGGDGNRQSYSAQATQSGPKRGAIGFGNRDGRDPTVSLTEDPVATAQKAREIIALGNVKRGLGDRMNFPNMFPTAKAALNLIKVRDGTFMDQARKDFDRELGPEEEEETGGDGGNNPFILPQYMMPTPSITDQEPEEQLTPIQQALLERGAARRFAAGGGIMNEDIIGGEFDFESARQMYGLGKLVKKATRAVKKVASSPIGKAAIAYTLTGGLGNLAGGRALFENFLSPRTFLGGAGDIFKKGALTNILNLSGAERGTGAAMDALKIGGAGSIILQDNSDSTTLFQGDCPTGDVFAFNIPEDGILFPGGMKVSTITNIEGATLLIDK